jgi:phosphoglycerol transferase MdoB-like AlkP superfamily enzyme
LDATSGESEVRYTDTLIDQAADAFYGAFFRTPYGRALVVAAIVNVAAVGFLVWLGLRDGFALFMVAMIAVLGVVYLIALRLYFPRRSSAMLKRRLMPGAKIAVTPSSFAITTAERAVKLPWSDVTRIIDRSDCFIVVLKPARAFTVISKQGLSDASQRMIRAASTQHGIAVVERQPAAG